MLKKIILALICGFIGTLFFAQFDGWTHQKIVELAQKIAHTSYGCHVSFTIQSFNFFFPLLIISDVQVTPLEGAEWSWHCKECVMQFSWIQFFLKGVVEEHLVMDDFECVSHCKDGVLAIESHIEKLMQESSLPIATELKSVVFRNAHISAYEPDDKGTVSLWFNSSSLKILQQMRTTMSLYDGDVQYQGVVYGKEISMDVLLTTWFENNVGKYAINCSGVVKLPHMSDDGVCSVGGMVTSGRGRCLIRNSYNSFMVDPIIITEREVRFNARFPLSYMMGCIKKTVESQDITGNVQCSVCIGRNNNGNIDGHLIVEDGIINGTYIAEVAKLAFIRRDSEWKSTFGVTRYNQECKGVAHWNEKTEHGRCEIRNSTPLSLGIAPYWRIAQNNFMCHAWFNHHECLGVYRAQAVNVLSNAQHSMYGGFSSTQGIVSINGLLDAREFDLQGSLYPHVSLHKCFYNDTDKKSLVFLQQLDSEPGVVEGYISFAFVRGFINTFFNYDVQGEGIFGVKGAISSDDVVADIVLDDATIRLPETYNFIDGFQSHIHYERKNRSLMVHDMHISLHTGALDCLCATFLFNKNGKLEFAHAPVLLDRCLFNRKKDLFAIVSGNLLLSQQDTSNLAVSGSIILDRAQLKENLFSSVIQRRLFDYSHSIFSNEYYQKKRV